MKQLGSVAVFCASSMPVDEAFIPQAQELGRTLAARGITLVYGGGSRGIMGALAEACHDAGGTVLGVLPEIFNTAKVLKKDVHSQLIITRDMHERKALMYEKADAFIILPGGIGTMDEFFEAYTWRQIGYHAKNIGLLDINGFFDKLLSFLDHMVDEGLLSQEARSSLIVEDDIDRLLERLALEEVALPGKVD